MIFRGGLRNVIYILMNEQKKIIQMNISDQEYTEMFQEINLLDIYEPVIRFSNTSFNIEKTVFEVKGTKIFHFLFTNEYLCESNKYERYIDVFTGLYNRNFWEEIIRKQIEIPCEDKYSIVIIDIDRLKELNDEYGHLAGDEAIRAVADAILYVLDRNQYGIRYGGDEFILILPDVNINELKNIMEKTSNIAASFFHNDEYKFDLAFSYGFTRTKRLDSMNNAFKKADMMMFQEKLSKGNKFK